MAMPYGGKNMNNHKKKMIAPIVVAIVFVLYFALYFGLLIATLDGVLKYALGIIPLLLAGVMLAVSVERIKEIQKGEEDDISKY